MLSFYIVEWSFYKLKIEYFSKILREIYAFMFLFRQFIYLSFSYLSWAMANIMSNVYNLNNTYKFWLNV